MEQLTAEDVIEQFTLSLLRSGVILSDLADRLVEDFGEGSFPGRDTDDVVFDLIVRSVSRTLEKDPPDQVRYAAAMVQSAVEGTIEYLEIAADALRNQHEDNDTPPD